MQLIDLGPRVAILGPSNSGKSTLAVAMGLSRALPVIHLDQLRHVPGTSWQTRSDSEFAALHDSAVAGDQWIIEGNYTNLFPQRVARTTGLVLLDASLVASVGRYLRRTWFDRERIGGLEGTRDRVNASMLVYIVGAGQRNRRRHGELFAAAAIPKVFLPSRPALDRFYSEQDLPSGRK